MVSSVLWLCKHRIYWWYRLLYFIEDVALREFWIPFIHKFWTKMKYFRFETCSEWVVYSMRVSCIRVDWFAEAQGCNTDLNCWCMAGGKRNGGFELQRCYFGVPSDQVKSLALVLPHCFCSEVIIFHVLLYHFWIFFGISLTLEDTSTLKCQKAWMLHSLAFHLVFALFRFSGRYDCGSFAALSNASIWLLPCWHVGWCLAVVQSEPI
jgi:hypothetical protein